MIYEINTNGTLAEFTIHVCEKHSDIENFIFDSTLDEKCNVIDYDGNKCQSLDVKKIKEFKHILEVNKTALNEKRAVFSKYLKIIGFSKLQYENFLRMTHLIMITLTNEIFTNNNNIDSPLSKKFLINYDYFLEKIKGFHHNFRFEKINTTDDLNQILPKYIKRNSLYSIPIDFYKNQSIMYRNYVIFINIMYAITRMDDRAKAYAEVYLKDECREITAYKLVLEVYKALFKQTDIKETDVPKLHALIEQHFRKSLPMFIDNIMHHYEKNLLKDSFQ